MLVANHSKRSLKALLGMTSFKASIDGVSSRTLVVAGTAVSSFLQACIFNSRARKALL